MFDWLIPLLIVIVLLLKILEYLDLLDIVATVVNLLVAAITGTLRFAIRLVRGSFDSSKRQP